MTNAPMRWTIQRQFLLPAIAIAVFCFVASSALVVYVTTRWAEEREREHLDQVVTAITEAGFPLTSTVLERMTGLSGAELAVVDSTGHVVTGPRWLDASAEASLRDLPISRQHELWSQPRLELGGQTFFAARIPLVSQSSPGHELSMVVMYPEDRWIEVRRQLGIGPLAIGLIGVVVLSLAITITAKRVVAPLERLRQSATAIAHGDFTSVPLPSRNDEVRDLTVSLNAMAEQLAQYETTIRQNERLRTLGQLGGGLAHQLRNAATGARMALDLHARSCSVTEDDPTIDVAIRQLNLMEVTIQRILTLGQTRSSSRFPVQFNTVVADACELLSPAFRHSHVELDCHTPPEPVTVLGDQKSLEQVVWNLLFNALEAVQQVEARRSVAIRLDSDGGHAKLVVDDSGRGPDRAIERDLFEPFATDKPSGTGLGLAVVKTIVDEHQGRIEWQRLGETTRFVVELPLINVKEQHGAPAHCG